MNYEVETALRQALSRAYETAGAFLTYEAICNVGEPCNASVTIGVERSSYNLNQTEVTLRFTAKVKHPEP